MQKQQTAAGFYRGLLEFIFFLLLVIVIRVFIFGLYQVPSGSMETTMLVGERFLADKISYFLRAPRRGEVISTNDPQYDYSKNKIKELIERFLWGPDNWTKRVIGLPGDEVLGIVEDGKPVVYINGKKLDEPYVNKYPLIAVTSPRSGTFSFDPAKGFDEQPFYRIDPRNVMRRADGNPKFIEPGYYLSSKNPDVLERLVQNDRYWDESDYFHVKLASDEYWLMGDNRLCSRDSRFIGPVKGKLINGRIIWRYWSLDSHEPWIIVDLIKHPIDFWKRIRWHRFFQIIR